MEITKINNTIGVEAFAQGDIASILLFSGVFIYIITKVIQTFLEIYEEEAIELDLKYREINKVKNDNNSKNIGSRQKIRNL